jgi:beta-glucosidase
VAAVHSGELDEADLNRSMERILELVQNAQAAQPANAPLDLDAQHAVARRVAGEGVVLLKNENDLLPLPGNARIALIGRFAKQPRYQGAGSSQVNPIRLENLLEELTKLVGEANVLYAPGYDEKGESSERLLQAAEEVAQKADVVVICAGLTEMDEIEGIDRRHMRLPPGHNTLIERLSTIHEKVAVVLSNGAPVEMPWVKAVSAILEGYLGGQAGAGAVADILLGKVNPSGKLAETFPLTIEDTPAQPYPGGPVTVPYCESLYVGYRYYDSAEIEVLFPFGHGLSYTSFAYHGLEVNQADEQVSVSFKIQNTGERNGKEIAQVYVKDLHASQFRPNKELKGFAKVELEPGQESWVNIELDRRAFAFYDDRRHNWIVEEGEFEILVGASSRDIRLSATVHIAGIVEEKSLDEERRLIVYFSPSKERAFNRQDFKALLGKPLPPNEIPQKGGFTLNTSLEDMTVTFAGRLFHRLISYFSVKMTHIADDTPTGAMVRASLRENPLRSLLMPGSPLTRPQLEAILMIINGKYLKGIQTLIQTRRNHGRLA